MNSRRIAVAAIALLVAALAVWLWLRPSAPAPAERASGQAGASTTPSTPNAVVGAASPAPAIATPLPGGPEAASTAGSPSTPPAASGPQSAPVLAAPNTATAPSETASVNAIKVRRMVTDYHTLYGENPVGTNAEIMAAILGKNSRQAVLGPPDGVGLNSKGELVDEWGTPYFFHQLSKDVMEIHSAGPDRTMGTADDIVVR